MSCYSIWVIDFSGEKIRKFQNSLEIFGSCDIAYTM